MKRNGTTKRGAKIQPHKRRGEWAEMCFMKHAAELGLEVSKPWGDSASYDFIVEKAGRVARVQVKSTLVRRNGGYVCQVHASQGSTYQRNTFDFVAAYLILEDMWYIIPAKMLRGKFNVRLYPGLTRSKYEPYREAWQLLPGTATTSGSIPSIEACAEEELDFLCSVPTSHGTESQTPVATI